MHQETLRHTARPPLILIALTLGVLAPSLAAAQSPPEPAQATVQSPDDLSEPPKERQPRGYFQVGAGYSSITGFQGHASVGHDRLFGVRDLRLQLRAMIMPLHSEASILLEGPFGAQSDWLWHTQLYHLDSGLNNSLKLSQTRTGGQLGIGKKLDRHWRVTVGGRAEAHTLNHGDVLLKNNGFSPLAQNPERTLTSVWIQAEHRSDNNPSMVYTDLPTGLHLIARLEHASSSLGSDYAFTHASMRGSYGVDLPLSMNFTVTGQAGAANINSADQMPLMDRYRLGTVHAFGGLMMPALGPTIDGTNAPLGGSAGAYGRAELSVPIWRKIGLYAFGGLEAGAIGNDLGRLDTFDAGATTFAGLKWLSPIGPLTFAWGKEVSAIGDNSDPLFVFQIGQSF